MPQIKHVVLLKFRAGTAAPKIADAMADLKKLQQSLPGFIDFTWGPNSSGEGLANGFTHGFVMTFADAKSFEAYLPHPQHEAAKQKLLSMLEGGINGVIVLDWYA